MNELNYAQLVDRYIDGESTPDDLTTVLQHAESQPDGWRLLALRLVESLELRATLQQMQPESVQAKVQTGPPLCGPPLCGPPFSESSLSESPLAPGRRPWTSVVCVACLLVLAFASGRYAGHPSAAAPQSIVPSVEKMVDVDRTNPGQAKPEIKTAALSNQPVPEASDAKTGSGAEEITNTAVTVIGFAHLHQPRGAQLLGPVLTGAQLDPQELLYQTPEVSEEFRRRAENKGLQVESVRQVMSLKLTDGQTLAVPLDSIGLRYVGQSVL